MYTVLDCYIKRVILSKIFIILSILIFLSAVIRLVDELRKIGTMNRTIYEVVLYIIFSIPKDLELFLSISTLLGGLLGLSILEINNELVVMQVSGYSKLQIFFSIVKVSIPILFCSIIFNEWVLPNSEQKIYLCCNQSKENDYFNSITKNIWCIDNNDFVCIERVLTYEKLSGVTLYKFYKSKKIKQIVFAEYAVFGGKNWDLFNVNELDFSDEIHIVSKKFPHFEWRSELNPYYLSIIAVHPHVLAISKLYRCIKYFNLVGQDSSHYQLVFWNKISSILSGFVMIIMAISCTFGPLYYTKIGMKLFLGSTIGFLFYIFNQIFGTLSIIYNIIPIVGSLLPSVIFLLVSLVMIKKYY